MVDPGTSDTEDYTDALLALGRERSRSPRRSVPPQRVPDDYSLQDTELLEWSYVTVRTSEDEPSDASEDYPRT